jgi:hypothetical protein
LGQVAERQDPVAEWQRGAPRQGTVGHSEGDRRKLLPRFPARPLVLDVITIGLPGD